MTQEEVDLIYDYLHENYEYKDGALINKNNNKELIGFISRNAVTIAYEICLRINRRKIHMHYSHAIYIYFNKKKPKHIQYANGNPVDNRIENLLEISMSKRNLLINHSGNNKNGYKGVLKDGNKYYARIMINKKYLRLGSYNTPLEAHHAYLKAKSELLNENS